MPWLCHYAGRAIFADASDMLMLADIAELAALFDIGKAVQVVKHRPYRTRHPIKYIGTSMQCPNVDYPKRMTPAVMLINCSIRRGLRSIRRWSTRWSLSGLLQLGWMDEADIGELPDKWNRIVDEGQPVEGAALLHFTAGSTGFPHYRNSTWRRSVARSARAHDGDRMTEPSNQMILDVLIEQGKIIGRLADAVDRLIEVLTEEDDADPNASLDDPPSGDEPETRGL